jgi:hypothetical protein
MLPRSFHLRQGNLPGGDLGSIYGKSAVIRVETRQIGGVKLAGYPVGISMSRRASFPCPSQH